MAFPITIDTTQLTYPHFLIEGQYDPEGEDARNFLPWGHTEKNPRKPPRAVWDLAPGTYRFMMFVRYSNGIVLNPAVSFEVTAEGTVDYPADCDGFLAGRGTSTLTLVGYEVTINAEQLAGLGACLVGFPIPEDIFYKQKTLRIMPAPCLARQCTNHQYANFSLDLGRDGKFTYNPTFDITNGGFLAGLGTANLEIIGYPIEIDATQLFYLNFIIPGITGWTKNDTPLTLNLLPDGYGFQVASGFYSRLGFDVTQQGTIDYSKYEHHNEFLSGQGTKTLTIRGYEVTIDARPLPGPIAFHNMPPFPIRHQTFRMVPSNSHTMTQGFVTDALPLIRLGLDGKFDYGNLGKEGEVGPYPDAPGFIPKPDYTVHPASSTDPKQQRGFMAGQGTSTLTFYGYPVLIDARVVEDAGLGIVYLDGVTSENSVNLVNLLPTTYTLVLNGLHTSFKFQFKLDTEGQLSFEPELTGFLEIESLNGVPVLKVLAIFS